MRNINIQVRSVSLPSTSQTPHSNTDDLLLRLKDSESEVEPSSFSSSSSSSICCKLLVVKDLYEDINKQIQGPSDQRALSLGQHRDSVEAVLEGSLFMLDSCASIVHILSLMKKSILDLESSIRRKIGLNDNEINAYMASMKNIHKMANRCTKNLQKLNPTKNGSGTYTVKMLREAEEVGLSTLKSILTYLSRANSTQHAWSLVTRLIHKDALCQRKAGGNEIEKILETILAFEAKKSSIDTKMVRVRLLKQLGTLESALEEIEQCLGSISRCLLKTRVSLLNILSQ